MGSTAETLYVRQPLTSTDQERVPNGGNPIQGERKDNAIRSTTELTNNGRKINAKQGRTKMRGGIGIMMGELSRCGSMRGSVSQKKKMNFMSKIIK